MTERQRYVLQGVLDGKTYAEIAKELGVTRQDVHMIAKAAISTRATFGLRKAKYYPNLVRYLAENGKSCRALSVEAGLIPNAVNSMVVNGKTLRWNNIQKLCEVTGLSAEELMARDGDDNLVEVEV